MKALDKMFTIDQCRSTKNPQCAKREYGAHSHQSVPLAVWSWNNLGGGKLNLRVRKSWLGFSSFKLVSMFVLFLQTKQHVCEDLHLAFQMSYSSSLHSLSSLRFGGGCKYLDWQWKGNVLPPHLTVSRSPHSSVWSRCLQRFNLFSRVWPPTHCIRRPLLPVVIDELRKTVCSCCVINFQRNVGFMNP